MNKINYAPLNIFNLAKSRLNNSKRTLKEFIRDEIRIPINSKFGGNQYNFNYQPIYNLVFDELSSGKYKSHAIVAPAQSGKTFNFTIIPALYALFELNEPSIIYAVPNRTIGKDIQDRIKWIISNSSSLGKYINPYGKGSMGGFAEKIEYLNGSCLYFLTAGGNDKSRSSITSRIIYFTEVDGYDHASEDGEESDKVSQMIFRTQSYGSDARFFYDSTPTNKNGRIWQEFEKGTKTFIQIPCVKCGDYFIPDRTDLIINVNDKYDTFIKCPNCTYHMNNDERIDSLSNCKLTHSVESDKLSIQYNCIHNKFNNLSDIAEKIIDASTRIDKKNAEQMITQFLFAQPYENLEKEDITLFEFDLSSNITDEIMQNELPDWTEFITIGVDVGKYLMHFTVNSYNENMTKCHTLNYGTIDTNYDTLGELKGFEIALKQIRDLTVKEYHLIQDNQIVKTIKPQFMGVDTGNFTQTLYAINSSYGFISCKGYSSNQSISNSFRAKYNQPDKCNSSIQFIGNDYHISLVNNAYLFHHNVDNEKLDVFKYFSNYQRKDDEIEESMVQYKYTIYNESSNIHKKFIKHLSNESYIIKNGKYKWIEKGANHYLDSFVISYLMAKYNKHIKELQNGQKKEIRNQSGNIIQYNRKSG